MENIRILEDNISQDSYLSLSLAAVDIFSFIFACNHLYNKGYSSIPFKGGDY